MRSQRTSLVAAIALSLVSGAASAQFSNTYIFGDSLSDAGQYGARFTTNPGPDVPDVPRRALRADDVAVVHRGHRLRAGRRARQLAVAAHSGRRAEPVDRAAGLHVPRQGTGRPERALPDPGRRERLPRAVRAIRGRRHQRGGRCRPA